MLMLHEKPNYAGLALDDMHLSEISNEIKTLIGEKEITEDFSTVIQNFMLHHFELGSNPVTSYHCHPHQSQG